MSQMQIKMYARNISWKALKNKKKFIRSITYTTQLFPFKHDWNSFSQISMPQEQLLFTGDLPAEDSNDCDNFCDAPRKETEVETMVRPHPTFSWSNDGSGD